jgi:hypothetical protein
VTAGLGNSEWVREGLRAAAERGQEIAEQASPIVGPRVSWHFEALPGTGGGNFSSAVYRMHYSPMEGTTARVYERESTRFGDATSLVH